MCFGKKNLLAGGILFSIASGWRILGPRLVLLKIFYEFLWFICTYVLDQVIWRSLDCWRRIPPPVTSCVRRSPRRIWAWNFLAMQKPNWPLPLCPTSSTACHNHRKSAHSAFSRISTCIMLGITVRRNSSGCRDCRPAYRAEHCTRGGWECRMRSASRSKLHFFPPRLFDKLRKT